MWQKSQQRNHRLNSFYPFTISRAVVSNVFRLQASVTQFGSEVGGKAVAGCMAARKSTYYLCFSFNNTGSAIAGSPSCGGRWKWLLSQPPTTECCWSPTSPGWIKWLSGQNPACRPQLTGSYSKGNPSRSRLGMSGRAIQGESYCWGIYSTLHSSKGLLLLITQRKTHWNYCIKKLLK